MIKNLFPGSGTFLARRAAAGRALLLFCAVLPAMGFRPYNQKPAPKTCWMSVTALKSGTEYYMELSQDGQAMMRTETRNRASTRRGRIPIQLVKDFFREIESSEVITAQGSAPSKIIFFRGEVLNISSYISGELRRTGAPLDSFGEAFAYAFGEAKKTIGKLPRDKKISGFLTAEPVEGEALESFLESASKMRRSGNIETYDIQKVKPLFSAIKQPYRLIALDSKDDIKSINEFISFFQLSGLSKLFYLPTTRGVFKCRVLEADK